MSRKKQISPLKSNLNKMTKLLLVLIQLLTIQLLAQPSPKMQPSRRYITNKNRLLILMTRNMHNLPELALKFLKCLICLLHEIATRIFYCSICCWSVVQDEDLPISTKCCECLRTWIWFCLRINWASRCFTGLANGQNAGCINNFWLECLERLWLWFTTMRQCYEAFISRPMTEFRLMNDLEYFIWNFIIIIKWLLLQCFCFL